METTDPRASSHRPQNASDAHPLGEQPATPAGPSSSSALTVPANAAQRAAHAGGLSLAPVVRGARLASAPPLPAVGAVVRLVARRTHAEVYARVLSSTADRVTVDYYGSPLAVTSRSPRWRLAPDPWATELAPLPAEVCPSPTLPPEESAHVG